MYQSFGTIRLKSGETVEAGVVRGPEPSWSQRLQKLLWHKGDPWNWQNAQLLEREQGLDVFFYVLHRNGDAFANIMTVELAGVGIFGHVWTKPADRQQGASSRLMQLQMQDFVARHGKALYLGTEYDSVAYKMYTHFGFRSVEPQSGYMAYYADSQTAFDDAYFAPGPVTIAPLRWPHWPAVSPLFLGDFRGLVRCAPLQLMGRVSPEGALLPALMENEKCEREEKAPPTLTLVNDATTAVVGLAAWRWDLIWPDTCVVDCYCHPDYWSHAGVLLGALQFPYDEADRIVAYVDQGNDAKAACLTQAGFQPTAILPQWITANVAKAASVDVTVYTKSS